MNYNNQPVAYYPSLSSLPSTNGTSFMFFDSCSKCGFMYQRGTAHQCGVPSELETTARLVVARVLSVYREDYIERCVREEPDSLLALVKRMEQILEVKV